MLISPAQLAQLAPNCDAEAIAPALSAAAEEYEINTARRLAHWTGQLSVESGGFRHLTENLNYSAERLCQVWPARFPNVAAAQPYAHNPQALAGKVYAGRMGNATPEEAADYLGRGWIMLTGKSNYATYAAKLGVDLVGHPELAAELVTASRIAGAYWSIHGLNALADADDIEAITRAINGGVVGLADRQAAVHLAKSVFSIRTT